MTHTIKRGDTRQVIKAVLANDGVPVNLAGATVRFLMAAHRTGTLVINRAAHIEDAAGGEVWYIWQAGDTATAGLYQAEIEVTFPDGRVETYPNADYLMVNIVPDLG